MKLNDLIKSNNWLSVELTLIQLYPDQEEILDEYRIVFEKLKIIEPTECDLEIVLTEYDCDPNFKSEKETYIDVSGRKKIPDPNSVTDSYAIEFLEWDKWLSMDLVPETTKHFSDLEIIAHCLYEMIFIGYDDEEIQEQLKSLEKTVDDYKSLTDEKKKKQTISLDELKRQLDEKKGSS